MITYSNCVRSSTFIDKLCVYYLVDSTDLNFVRNFGEC